MDNWKKDILKIPNLLSLLRLGLIPIYISIFLNARSLRDYWLAGGILALSCLTDLVDGYIARKYDLITTLGKLLDPIADKFTQLVLTICLSMKYPVLWPVLILFLIKEFFQFFAALAHYRQGKALDGALMSGKICTCVLFGGFTLLMFLNKKRNDCRKHGRNKSRKPYERSYNFKSSAQRAYTFNTAQL